MCLDETTLIIFYLGYWEDDFISGIMSGVALKDQTKLSYLHS